MYIGKTMKSLSRRKRQHKSASFGKAPTTVFHRALRKYGLSAFSWEVIFNSDDQFELIAAEIRFIESMKTYIPAGYNMTTGGDGIPLPAEARQKIGKANKGHRHSEETKRHLRLINLGKKMAPESIAKTAAALTGRKRSEEARLNISQARRQGIREGRIKPTFGFAGKHRTQETRQAISLAQKGKKRKPLTDAHKQAISRARRLRESIRQQHSVPMVEAGV